MYEINFQQRVFFRLEQIQQTLNQILQQGVKIMATVSPELQALATQIEQNTSVEASAVTLLLQLSTEIAAAAEDPTPVTALAQQLQTSAVALAQAIAANTPVAPVVVNQAGHRIPPAE